jgi:hypothetical protein
MMVVSPAPSRDDTTIAKEKLRLQEYGHNMYIKGADILRRDSIGCNERDFLREDVRLILFSRMFREHSSQDHATGNPLVADSADTLQSESKI